MVANCGRDAWCFKGNNRTPHRFAAYALSQDIGEKLVVQVGVVVRVFRMVDLKFNGRNSQPAKAKGLTEGRGLPPWQDTLSQGCYSSCRVSSTRDLPGLAYLGSRYTIQS